MGAVVTALLVIGSVARRPGCLPSPVTPGEQIDLTRDAYRAGATNVRVHVRDDDDFSSSGPDSLDAILEGVRRLCPKMLVQLSTGACVRNDQRPGGRGEVCDLHDSRQIGIKSINLPRPIDVDLLRTEIAPC